jgi:chromosome segregation ATPase
VLSSISGHNRRGPEVYNGVMFGRRRREKDVEELGIIRRTLQDVLVPEMQGIKERLAGHDEKFVSIAQRFDEVDKRFDAIDRRFEQVDKRFDAMDRRFDALEKSVAELRSVVERLVVAVERIESRLQFVEFDKRLYRLEILAEQAGRGSKSAPAA